LLSRISRTTKTAPRMIAIELKKAMLESISPKLTARSGTKRCVAHLGFLMSVPSLA
jgi:hypothetical protein